MKSIFALWSDVKISQLNRLLRPFNCRLVSKGSKNWGDKVVITAEMIPNAAADLIPPGPGSGRAPEGLPGGM